MLFYRLRGNPLHSSTTGGQIIPFEREMCCDVVSLNVHLCYDTVDTLLKDGERRFFFVLFKKKHHYCWINFGFQLAVMSFPRAAVALC